MGENPIAKWTSITVGLLSLLAMAAGVWWYFQDDKLRNEQWYADDSKWNTAIISDLADIKAQLSKMEQNIIIAIDRHEEFVSVEHRDVKGTLTTSLDDLNYRLGVHAGRHMSCP